MKRDFTYPGNSLVLPLLCFLVLHPPPTSSHEDGWIKMLLTSPTMSMRNFKPGVVVEALPEAIHYNKYIPLVFNLPVPELSVDTLRLNTSFHCNSDKDSAFLCPVTYHIDRILAPIADSMNFAKNIQKPKGGWPFFGKFSCERIAPHFFHLSAPVDKLHLYTDELRRRCPLASNSFPVLKNMTLDPADQVDVASDKFNTFVTTSSFNKNIKIKDGRTSDGLERMVQLQMAGYVGFQATRLLAKYVDRIRWNNAFSMCQSSRLSIALINVFWLKTVLLPVEKLAEDSGYKLALPVQELLPLYYKLPLTDCILGIEDNQKTTMAIRVLVPIVKKGTKYTRFRLNKIPYLILDGDQKKICEIRGFDPKDDILLEETLGVPGGAPILTLAPTCAESELCHIPEQPRQLVVDPCVKGLMNSSVDIVRDDCAFDCFPVESENEAAVLPIIIKLAPNEYSITGASPSGLPIQVFCDGKFNETVEPSSTRLLMEVILPCNCEIRFKTEIYRSSRPCDAPFEITYVLAMPFKVYPGGRLVHVDGKSQIPEASTMTETVRDEKFVSSYLDNASSNPWVGNYSAAEITAGDELIPDQVISASWIIQPGPSPSATSSQSVVARNENGVWPFVMIWILLILLSLSNGFLVWVLCRHGLIDLGGVRLALSRWGWMRSSISPRAKLREEDGQEVVGANGQQTIVPGGRSQLNIEEPHINVQEDWPQNWPPHVNRL